MSSNQGSFVTAAGQQQLVIKNVDRIEAIVTHRPDTRCDVSLYNFAFSRLLRRDYNLTSVKLFFFCMNEKQWRLARELLLTLVDEANALENIAAPYELPSAPFFMSCTMRIISDEAQLLLDALTTADRAYHKLLSSPMGEIAEENLIPFMVAYNALRQKVFGYPPKVIS